MIPRILVAASLIALSLPAYCQAPMANRTNTVPDYVLYGHFMHRVVWLEAQADNLKAKGKNDTFLRSWIRVHAALTAAEELSLKTIAADSQATTSALMSSIDALVSSGANRVTSQQVQALLSQRRQTVLDHMGQLQSAFGPGKYTALDTYIRRSVQFGVNAPVPAGFVPKVPPVVPGPVK